MEHTDGKPGQTCKGCRYMSVGNYCRRFAIEEDVFPVWDTRQACKGYEPNEIPLWEKIIILLLCVMFWAWLFSMLVKPLSW